MGKSEKTALGRALVRQHNQMIIQSKEKGRLYNKQNKKVLESVTEVSDIEAIIERSNEPDQVEDEDDADAESDSQLLFNLPAPNLPITLDTSSSISEMTPEERRELQKNEEALHASSLQIPRRPSWTTEMSVEELDTNERHAFLAWRRGLARLEENENLVLTPFEKNLDIWRQLWRVVERSDLLVMVVDARDPLFYRCPDLEVYAQEIDPHKRTLLLVNKADLLPLSVRGKWADYFHLHGILFVFWSAKAASAAIEGKPSTSSDLQESDNTKIHGRDELLARLQFEAEQIAEKRKNVSESSPSNSVIVGFVGYPNVGKSSTINALVGQKRTGVTSTPGKTKHFQTIIISEKLTLCDCPGLVFPSFTSSRYEMIASGVLPIDRMTENRAAVQVVADRVPRSVIERVYNISIPKPKPYEDQSRAPLAAELLRAYCKSRNYVASSGLPDETRAARQILKDYLDGKLPHYQIPPGMTADMEVSSPSGLETLSEESDGIDDEDTPRLDKRVMDDLNQFDVSQGIVSKPIKKKAVKADKHHKKPQKKKDRTWRVGHEDVDGMPVKFFQKPLVTGPMKTVG